MATVKTYHYAVSANARETAPESQLPDLVSAGIVRPDTLLWTDGLTQWTPAAQVVPELFAGPRAGAPPPLPNAGTTNLRSHAIDFEIHGDDLQMVEIELDPGETVIAEAGAMCFMEEGIEFETKMGDGSAPVSGFMGAIKAIGKRVLTGESIFMTHFTHRGRQAKSKVCFAAPYPGKIVPLKLAELGGEILCEKDAFLCAALGTSVGIAFNQKLGVGFFGGEGFILQRLKGDGLAFVHAGGTIIRRDLRGEMLRVDTGCLVAMTSGIQYDIQKAGNLKSMVFGGEGLFLSTLRGHGTVWLQSLPFSRMADRILANAPGHGGGATGEGSVLGGLGRLLDGN
jgi:uncharacterized protein (TIGR00266 family)